MRVSAERKRLGMSQKELARRMQVAQPHLSLLEQAKRGWTIDQLATAAESLGVDMADLLTESATVSASELAVLNAIRSGDAVAVMNAVATAMSKGGQK